MKNRLLLILSLLLFTSPVFMEGAPSRNRLDATTPGGQSVAPIDTYEIILVVAAVLLMVGAIAYKKLSVRKVA